MQPTDSSWTSICGINWKNAMKATVKLKDQYYGDWDKKLQDFITKADEDTSMPRTMYMLRLSWPRRNGVTVIGDCSLDDTIRR